MTDDNRNSQIQDPKRTKSLMGSFRGSFKMAQSLLVPGSNKKVINLSLPGIKFVQKSQYKEQKVCQVCFIGFGKLTRQHHCRICANAVCSSCSASSINKQRCCDVCAYKYSNSDRETAKDNIRFQLQGAAMMFVEHRNAMQAQIKKVNQQSVEIESIQKTIKGSQQKILDLQKKLQQFKNVRARYQQQIALLSK